MSLAMKLCQMAKLYHLAEMFGSPGFPAVTGFLLVLFHVKFGIENLALIGKYRAEGKAYHTMSRGTPRWGKEGVFVAFGMAVVLLLFNLPAGVLFVISCFMSSKIAAEQQATIYSRYLDALDQKIEQEYLENAILGTCPTEITYLTKPLDANLNDQMRTDIAAAAVGKPVSIIAQGPKRDSEALRQKPVLESASARVKSDSETRTSPPENSGEVADAERPTPAKRNTAKETSSTIPVSKNLLAFIVVGLVVVGGVFGGIKLFHPHKSQSSVVASVPAQSEPPLPMAPKQIEIVNAKPVSPAAAIQAPSAAPAVAPASEASSTIAPVDSAALAQANEQQKQ